MVTPVLLLKLELGPGLAEDDPVRLLVVSAESRATFWGADSKPAFNCGGAGVFGGIPPRGWICGGNWGILLDSGSLSIFFDMVSIVISSLCTVLQHLHFLLEVKDLLTLFMYSELEDAIYKLK